MHVHEANASTLAAKRNTPKKAITKRAIICGFGKFEMSDCDKNCCALNYTNLTTSEQYIKGAHIVLCSGKKDINTKTVVKNDQWKRQAS